MCRRIITTTVFFLCVALGLLIASLKPLWNDELFTLTKSIQLPYSTILLGGIQEGNNTPLFYLAQKLLFQAMGYKVPAQWLSGDSTGTHFSSQLIVRLLPIVFMSLSIALLFNLFYKKYAWWAGVYSLVMYSSCYMLWVYWAECRPYSLIILFSTLQVYFLVQLLDGRIQWDKTWKWLTALHILYSFTYIFSLGQICAVSTLIWVIGHRKLKYFILLTLIPIVICTYYYALAPKYLFYFGMKPEQLIRDSFSRWEFYIVCIGALCVFLNKVKSFTPLVKNLSSKALMGVQPFLIYTSLVLSSAIFLVVLFLLKTSTPPQGFPVSNRYFIYLVPVGIAAGVWFSIATVKFFENYLWAQALLVGFISYLLLKGLSKILPSALNSLLGS